MIDNCNRISKKTGTSNTLYLECSSGISGDMVVAALLDLGADEAALRAALASLPLEGYSVRISRVQKSAISVCDFDVVLDSEENGRDHDLHYLHDHDKEHHGHTHVHNEEHHDHSHTHEQNEEHHDHSHTHQHSEEHHDHSHAHSHVHRGLPEITDILKAGSLTPSALSLALRIFGIIAEAEAAVHEKPVEEVHFHEVGAVDSIVDIAAAAVCIDLLGIDRVIIPYLTEGIGTVRCQHGLLPIPVPAVTQIVSRWNIPMHTIPVRGELVTPTGAAIAAALCQSNSLPDHYTVIKTGMGAGKRDYPTAGILRAHLIRETIPENSDVILDLNTNIDDCSPEALGFVMDELLSHGARDVFYVPVTMKKNRPGIWVHVICTPDLRREMETILFRHTTTIGIRCQQMGRTVLPRRVYEVNTSLGPALVKEVTWQEETFRYPEYESAARISRETGRSFEDVCAEIKKTAAAQAPAVSELTYS